MFGEYQFRIRKEEAPMSERAERFKSLYQYGIIICQLT